jgi:hypothetical protein
MYVRTSTVKPGYTAARSRSGAGPRRTDSFAAVPAAHEPIVSNPTSPESEHCQRWSDGKQSWRHTSDGGFNADLFEVIPVHESVARAFTTRHHYSGSYPAGRLAYALLTREPHLVAEATEMVDGLALVGVAVLSIPMSTAALTNVFPNLLPFQESLELGRFVLTDTPANAESWFLARVWEHAAAAGIRGIVSFADPMPRHREILDIDQYGSSVIRTEVITPGHVGVIYQATNGRALGRSTARTLTYLPSAGIVLSDRTLSKIRGQERGADGAERQLVGLGARARRAGESARAWLPEALTDLGVTKVRHPGNFRYAWTLGTPSQRRHTAIGLADTRYPKARTDIVGAAA